MKKKKIVFTMHLTRACPLVVAVSLGLMSPVFAADTSPPSAPGQPTEGSPDADYDSDGAYTVFWAAATDPESGIFGYLLQECLGLSGTWQKVKTTSATSVTLTGRQHATQYFYRVRAANGARLFSGWSSVSDGLLVDTTAPSAVTVTDEGVYTSSTTQLHATWTASSDPESGLLDYQYQIRQDDPTGPLIRDWISVGLVTEVTATDISLTEGLTYVLGVQAQNGAGTVSAASFSDGILVDATPPTGTISINDNAAYTPTPPNRYRRCQPDLARGTAPHPCGT